jgi:hypothetical protein
MSVTMELTACIAQHWLKLLPAVMSLVQGHTYDSGVCDSGVSIIHFRFHGSLTDKLFFILVVVGG